MQSCSPTDVIKQWLESNQIIALEDAIQALLQLEKHAKKEASLPVVNDLMGAWRLRLIGNKRSPNAEKTQKGRGKALPQWLNIQLTYQSQELQSDRQGDPVSSRGTLLNRVQVGALVLELSGPWSYNAASRMMAFDFLNVKLVCFGRSLLSTPIRGGKVAEDTFWELPLKDKAFFKYFWVSPDAIAARGKGGGIALWSKVD